MNTRARSALVAVAVFVGALFGTPLPVAADPAPDLETLLIQLANQERAKVGAPALTAASDLTAVAGAWSIEMVEQRAFYHRFNLFDTGVVCCWSYLSENIAYRAEPASTSPEDAARALHAQWMNSPPHRANILNPLVREIGLGLEVVDDANGWRWYVATANFRQRQSGTTPPTVARDPRGADCGMPGNGFDFYDSLTQAQAAGVDRCGTHDGSPTPPTSRSTTETCAAAPPSGFSDVTTNNVHSDAIDCIKYYGVTFGKGDGRYAPAEIMRRGQLSSFLVRILQEAGVSLPSNPPDAFDDDDNSPHEDAVNILAALGIVDTSDRLFYPLAEPSRAEMAELADATLQAAGVTGSTQYDYFTDDDGWGQQDAINRIAFLGIVTGKTAGRYDPSARLRRDTMATFLTRILDAILEA